MKKIIMQRINHMIGSVKRIPDWVQLSKSAKPSQQRGGYNGLKSECLLLMKESFRLWWYLTWHRPKIRDTTKGLREAENIVDKASSPDFQRIPVSMAGWKRMGSTIINGETLEVWRNGPLKRYRRPGTHEIVED